MNLNNILKKLITTEDRKNLHDYVFNMLLHNTDQAVLEYCIHAICEDKKPIVLHTNDIIWFNPVDNMYELEDILMDADKLVDANLLNKDGLLKGRIISDTGYQERCNPYAAEYKVNAYIGIKDNYEGKFKEIRIKRQNIWAIVEEDSV